MIDLELISKLVAAHRNEDVTTVGALRRRLEHWWCLKYVKPFRDPLLQTYTLEELAYEYLFYHQLEKNPEEERKKDEAADLEWAKSMLAAKQAPETKKETPAPTVPDLPEISTTFSPEVG